MATATELWRVARLRYKLFLKFFSKIVRSQTGKRIQPVTR